MKKITAIALCLVLAFASVNISAKVGGTRAKAHDLQAAAAIGIIDAQYIAQPEKVLTRGEVIDMVVKLYGSSALEKNPEFSDVTEHDKYYESIKKAVGMGVIKGYGDGTLRAGNEATVAETVIMLLSVLGYGELIDGGMTVSAALSKAKIGAVSDGANTRPITAEKLASLVMDACESKPAVLSVGGKDYQYEFSNDCLMELYLDIHKTEGMVTANETTSLKSADGAGDNRLKLDSEIYFDRNGVFGKYLGYNVICYYKDNGGVSNEIIYMYADKTEVTVISADDIEEFRANKLYYNENGRVKNIDVNLAAVDFIYNNSFEIAPSPSDFDIDCGSVTLIDSDNDGNIDLLIIDCYEDYVISYTDRSCEKIYGKYNAAPIDLEDYDNISFLSDRGMPMYLNEISEWDVISVQKSRNGKSLKMVYSSSNIDGTIDYINIEDEKAVISINNKEYFITKDCRENMKKDIKAGNSGEFCLDIFGKIAAVRFEETEHFGWLIRTGKNTRDKNREEAKKIKAKLMTEAGDVVIKGFADNILFDGERTKSKDIAETDRNQLIRYKENKDGLLTYIDTEATNSDEVSGKTLEKYYDGCTLDQNGNLKSSEKLKFKSATGLFDSRIGISERTVVFEVPLNAEFAADDDYWCLNKSYFLNDSSYNFQAFRIDEENIAADAMVVYKKVEDGEKVDTDSAITVVDKIKYVSDENGDFSAMLIGFRGKANVKYRFKDESVYNGIKLKDSSEKVTLERGDAVQLKINHKNEIVGCDVIYKNNSDTLYNGSCIVGEWQALFHLMLGYAYERKDDLCYMTTTDITDSGYVDGTTALNDVRLRGFKNFDILRVDTVNKCVEISDIEHIASYNKAGTGASRILVYERYAEPRLCIIYE